MGDTLAQVVISILGAVVGALPGFLFWWLLDYGAWGIFVAWAGAFVGCALTFPSVSGRRVLGFTAMWLIGHNTSHEWGESVYRAIADDAEDEPNSTENQTSNRIYAVTSAKGSDTIEMLPREKPASSLSVSSLMFGLLPLSLLFISVYFQVEERHKKLQIETPTMSKESSQKLAEDIRNWQELHSIVLGNKPIPKKGERDWVERFLLINLAKLQEDPKTHPDHIKRFEKSLKYWRERKEEHYRKETPPAAVAELEKAAAVETTKN